MLPVCYPLPKPRTVPEPFLHTHPYPPFLFPGVEKVIVGTLPPPRFTTRQLKEGDVNFCYGSKDGLLWPILDRIFAIGLHYETSTVAIEQRKNFLRQKKIGICDIVASCERQKIDASDLGMQQVVLRNLVEILMCYPSVDQLLFTGGNSKNGPEYFFRRHLKNRGLGLELVSDQVPRIHRFTLPTSATSKGGDNKRAITTVSLTAPSGAANRAIGSMIAYKERKYRDPKFNTFDFRVMQYAPFFKMGLD